MATNSQGISAGEVSLLVLFLGLGTYALVESFSFGGDAATFPQLVSGIMLGAVAIEVVRLGLKRGVHESGIPSPSDLRATVPEYRSLVPRRNFLFLLGMLFFYILASYLVGFLWSSPLFTLIYTVTQRQPWYVILSLTVLALAIPYLIQIALEMDLSSGVLLTTGLGGP